MLSNQDAGTANADTEVWGGPLSGGCFVMAAVNRGSDNATVRLNWTMLELSNVSAASRFDVRDLWGRSVLLRGRAGGFVASVPPHDIAMFRLVPATT